MQARSGTAVFAGGRRVFAVAIAGVTVVTAIACSAPTSPSDHAGRTSRAAGMGGTVGAEVVAAADAGCLSLGQTVQPSPDGGTFTVALTASCLWSVTSDQPWLTTSSRPSTWAGRDTITYVVTANTSFTTRTGRLTITGGGDTLEIVVTQAGAGVPPPPCTYLLSPTSAPAPSGGGSSFTVTLTAGCAWTASSDQPWLTITSTASGSGNATIGYAVAANPSTATARTGHITVSGTGGTAQLTVTQSATFCTYAFSPPSASVPSGGGSGLTVTLTAGCAWSAASDQPWLTITSAASGPGNATITYAVAANPSTTTARTANITVSGAGGTARLTVTQNPTPCAYTLTPLTASVPTGGGSAFTVSLTAACAWTVLSDQPWLTITTASSGTGNATISYNVAALVGTTARIGHIMVTGAGGSAQLTVTQGPPANVIVAVSPNPVGHSTGPIADPACTNIPNRWFYNETLSETRGVSVRITQRVDRLDGAMFKQGTVDYAVPAGASLTNSVAWCLTPDVTRTMQTTFSGTDANGNAVSVTGPPVTLLSAGDSGINATANAASAGGGGAAR